MIIGHLPIGYLITKVATGIWPGRMQSNRLFMVVGLLGSIAPDFDMIYFHLVDNRQHHHHSYWSHIPLYWLIVLVAMFLILQMTGKRTWLPLLGVFGANVLLHLVADTIVGDIWWLAPIVDQPYALFTVPALYQPWWLNFILHWSFALEVGLALGAAFLFWQSNVQPKGQCA